MSDIVDRLTCSEEHAADAAIPLVAFEAADEITRLREVKAELTARLASAEALMSLIAFGIIQSGYRPKKDSNNPMEDWLQRVADWKEAAPEQPEQEPAP